MLFEFHSGSYISYDMGVPRVYNGFHVNMRAQRERVRGSVHLFFFTHKKMLREMQYNSGI